MSKCALYIPRPGMTSETIQHGYVDALRYLGWKVYVGDPKTKLGCRQSIEKYGVRLIMTSSRYGIRQLPIDVINANQVQVFVDVLPLNEAGMTIDGPYELAHQDEPDIIQNIESVVAHTRLEPHLWNSYLQTWHTKNVDIAHIPLAGCVSAIVVG